MPDWNLSLVLDALRRAPFGPLGEAILKHLTLKTVFLLALASGRRRSELGVLSFLNQCALLSEHSTCIYTWRRDWAFLPIRSRTWSRNGSRSLDRIVGPEDSQERILCPVRALSWYRDRTKSSRRDNEHMFVCYATGWEHKEASPTTISRWITETIRLAYQLANKSSELNTIHHIRSHDVRALANSLAFSSGSSMEHILRAGFWKSETVFINFYLKDLTVIESGLRRLGPLVTGQTVFPGSSTQPGTSRDFPPPSNNRRKRKKKGG
jgi:hypothetical protein